jgi:hypothetical protein
MVVSQLNADFPPICKKDALAVQMALLSDYYMMTPCHYVIFYVICSQNGVHKETYVAKRAEKLKKMKEGKHVMIW